ncbi:MULTISPECIES: hypothetical protein [unclassified Chryseobacterium]|uniref:hypothetical protein n=1 Tax=unclassified Chryseobacterium TaxID=2593645 RepID=UPI0028533795|nr:hypothetical protein [Chryseobacterium sp. CFS7]MDR4892235.1 hypothetical protein [Chryseobacterium sp. CFS7]
MIRVKETISPVLSEFLKEFTTKDDRADVINNVSGVGTSTLRDLVYRVNPVTYNSLPALKLLLLKASENADAKIRQARSCKKEVKKVIDCI